MIHKNPHTNGVSLVYDVSRWDTYQWSSFKNQSPDTQNILEQGAAKLFSFPAFAKEVFHRLYSPHTKLLAQIKHEHAWAWKAHDNLSQIPDFERLAIRCQGDRFLAGIAATAFCEMMLTDLPTPTEPLQDPQPLRDQVRGLKAMQQHAQDAGKPFPLSMQQMMEELAFQGKKAVEKATQYTESLDESELRQIVRVACERADKRIDQILVQLESFSFGNHTGLQDTGGSLEEKMVLAQQIQQSPKLQQIAREAGRLRRIAAQKQRSRSQHARSEVSSIETGAELSRLLPSEMLTLADPNLFGLFARGYTERNLLQYQLTGKEPQGKGPIVVCLDSSGSMTGHREVWSKAVALALLSIAVMQKRTCRVIHFTSVVERVDDFPPGQIEVSRLLGSMEVFFDGGTSFEAPLRSALEAIQIERTLKQADFIFITDGECSISNSFTEEWQTARNELMFSVYSILLDCHNHTSIASLSDKVFYLSDLSKDSAITDTIFSI